MGLGEGNGGGSERGKEEGETKKEEKKEKRGGGSLAGYYYEGWKKRNGGGNGARGAGWRAHRLLGSKVTNAFGSPWLLFLCGIEKEKRARIEKRERGAR